jgi:hypothetical protein
MAWKENNRIDYEIQENLVIITIRISRRRCDMPETKELKSMLKVFTQQIYCGKIDNNVVLTDGTIAFILKDYAVDKEFLEQQNFAKLTDSMIESLKEYMNKELSRTIRLNGSLIHYLAKTMPVNDNVLLHFDQDTGRILKDSILIITPLEFEEAQKMPAEKKEEKSETSARKRRRSEKQAVETEKPAEAVQEETTPQKEEKKFRHLRKLPF